MTLRYFCFVLLLCATVSAYDLSDLNSDIQLIELTAKTDEEAAFRKLSKLALPTKIPLISGSRDAYMKLKIGDALTAIEPLVLKGLTDLRGDWDEGTFGLLYYFNTSNKLRSFLLNYVSDDSIGFSRTRLYDVAFRHGLLDAEFRLRALIDFEHFKNRGATGLCGLAVEWGFPELIPYYEELLKRDVKCEDSSIQHGVLSGYAVSAEALLHFNNVPEHFLDLIKMRLVALENCVLFNEERALKSKLSSTIAFLSHRRTNKIPTALTEYTPASDQKNLASASDKSLTASSEKQISGELESAYAHVFVFGALGAASVIFLWRRKLRKKTRSQIPSGKPKG